MKREKQSSFRDKIARNTQKQREARRSYGYLNLPKGVQVLSIDEGQTRVELDFLPYVVTDEKHPDRDNQYDIAIPGTQWYRRPTKVHRNVGVDNDTVVCPRSIGHKCPICEYREKRAKEGADKDEIKELYPRSRSLYVVVPLNVKKFEQRPTIWDMSDFLFQEILNDALEEDESYRDFPDLQNGKTLTLRIKWKAIGTSNFPDVRSIDFNDRNPYDDEILKEIPNLDEVLKIHTYQELHDMFFAQVDEVKEEEEEEIREETTIHRRKFNGHVRKEGVEEEEEEEEEVEEEEEKPVRRPTRTSAKEEPVKKDKCPHGHKFGVDTDEYDDCEICDIWDECIEKKERK